MITTIFKGLVAGALLMATTGVLMAQTFPVRLVRGGSNGICDNLTANRMSVDPASGRVTLEGVNGMTCLPDGAAGLANVSVNVTPGPHASGTANISAVVQNIPAGASCTLRGVTNVQGSGLVLGDGWIDGAPLCTACGTAATRSLTLTNASVAANWVVQFNVQCSITSGGYAVSAPVVSSNQVTVEPAAVAAGDCPYGDNVPTDNHDGLTIASRQLQVQVVANGFGGPGLKDAQFYTSLFSAHPGGTVGGRVLPSAGPTADGYGYPGSHSSNFTYSLQTTKFIALKFRVPSSAAWKGISAWVVPFSPTPQSGTSTPVSWSIAPCPGQFRASALAPLPATCFNNTQATESGGVKTIVSDPANPYSGSQACPIEMGKYYYLNIMAVDPALPGHLAPANATQNSWCPNGSSCVVRMGRGPLNLETFYN